MEKKLEQEHKLTYSFDTSAVISEDEVDALDDSLSMEKNDIDDLLQTMDHVEVTTTEKELKKPEENWARFIHARKTVRTFLKQKGKFSKEIDVMIRKEVSYILEHVTFESDMYVQGDLPWTHCPTCFHKLEKAGKFFKQIHKMGHKIPLPKKCQMFLLAANWIIEMIHHQDQDMSSIIDLQLDDFDF